MAPEQGLGYEKSRTVCGGIWEVEETELGDRLEVGYGWKTGLCCCQRVLESKPSAPLQWTTHSDFFPNTVMQKKGEESSLTVENPDKYYLS